jgi:uncharacterized protein (TIGR01244 family)
MSPTCLTEHRSQQTKAWKAIRLIVAAIAAALPCAPLSAQVKHVDTPGITNFSRVDDNVGCGGATAPSAMAELKKQGFVSVINLRLASEEGADIDASRAAARAAGLEYIHLPFDSAKPDPQVVEKFLAAVKVDGNQPVYIHCKSANRVGVLWMIKRVLQDGWEIDKARDEATAIGLSGPQANLLAVNYIMAHQPNETDTQKVGAFGDVHMDVSCAPELADDFDAALALLHNFWYKRALESFTAIIEADPECAMAYWGAAMTYYHPFWDPPSKEELAAAWDLVQRGLKAKKMSPREKMFLDAVAALYKDEWAGSTKTERVQAYLAAMAATVDKYPDDETRLFYGQILLSTMPEGAVSNEIQPVVANILEEIYAKKPNHPGVLHYLTHVYDDPLNAEKGIPAARAYAKSAAAVPHAHHMPSHIFARLGMWEDSATSNENAWRISQADVKHAGESGEHQDFHALNYMQNAYIQLGRYRDARRVTQIIYDQYEALESKTTAPDSPLLQAKHVKGRTIFGLPDRVVFGFSDMLIRYLIETEDSEGFAKVPLVAPSRDFVAMKLELDAAAAARRGDPAAANAAADKLVKLSEEPGQDPFVKLIITIQAREAEGFAAFAAGDDDAVIEKMEAAGRMEDSIVALSQPSYPALPAREIFGKMLLEMNRPAAAKVQFEMTLARTPRRPKSIYGIARAAELLGDRETATKRYVEFLDVWKNADEDRPELAVARKFLGITREQKGAFNADGTRVNGLVNLPQATPAWKLNSVEGVPVSNQDYRDCNLLLVFHQGLDCLLCAEQLTSLAKSAKDFQDRGIGIVAVSPKWPSPKELQNARKELQIEYPFLVDPELKAFDRFGCFDDRVLHGSFLIDSSGVVRWQSVGDKPVLNMETILEAARENNLIVANDD